MANANHRFIDTKRGGEALVVDNYMYRIDKTMPDGKRYWKCREMGCKATAVTENRNLVRACSATAHNHTSEELHVQREEFKNEMKNEVSSNCLKHLGSGYET
jgi:FLYWCH zinc finger domain